MAIPKFTAFFLPLLEFVGDKKEHTIQEAIEYLISEFNITKEERNELLPSGTQPVFSNRVGWARTYLKKASLVEVKKRGHFNITDEGLKVLKSNPRTIDIKFLEEYESFYEFRHGSTDNGNNGGEKTPEEQFEEAYLEMRENWAEDLLNKIKNNPPEFFEKLVVDLLIKMGYGGSRPEAGKAVGKSGDGGIDGVIKEDKLGLDIVYIQAKRYDKGPIGSSHIRTFSGSLDGEGAKKGVFITTSTFTKPALEFASKPSSKKIALIDGKKLANLMIEHDIGVSTTETYKLKRIDEDYFELND